jgi:hypothetical protein
MKPVAYQVWDRMGGISFRLRKPDESEYVEWDALYAAPPKREWVGLTDDDIHDLFMTNEYIDDSVVFEPIARAIEAKLKEKNT